MKFRQHVGHNEAAQPDCPVQFNFPDDPPHFPNVSFDFGVGISQQTLANDDRRTVDWWKRIAWDWRENVRAGVNEFLSKMSHTHHTGDAWTEWMWRAWKAYNGTGPQATQYANTLQASPEGQLVRNSDPVPADWHPVVAPILTASDREPAPPWPLYELPAFESSTRYA